MDNAFNTAMTHKAVVQTIMCSHPFAAMPEPICREIQVPFRGRQGWRSRGTFQERLAIPDWRQQCLPGEVADSDVVAHRSLTVEDTEAAKIKRNQVAMLQPTVFDLSVTEIAALRQKIFGMLKLINGQETSPEAQDALRASLAEKLATPGG